MVDEGIGFEGSPSIAITGSLEAWFSCTAFVDEEAVAATIEKAALVALPTISLIMIVN